MATPAYHGVGDVHYAEQEVHLPIADEDHTASGRPAASWSSTLFNLTNTAIGAGTLVGHQSFAISLLILPTFPIMFNMYLSDIRCSTYFYNRCTLHVHSPTLAGPSIHLARVWTLAWYTADRDRGMALVVRPVCAASSTAFHFDMHLLAVCHSPFIHQSFSQLVR